MSQQHWFPPIKNVICFLMVIQHMSNDAPSLTGFNSTFIFTHCSPSIAEPWCYDLLQHFDEVECEIWNDGEAPDS